MAVQNIRIKYVVDKSDIDEAKKSLQSLDSAEKQVKSDFDNINSSATKALNNVSEGSDKAKKNTTDLSSTLKGIGAVVAAGFAIDKIIAFGSQVIKVRGEFEKLEAVLTNTLGSKSLAKVALADITEAAAKTNFGVIELTQSFVKLTNQGFQPTRDQLFNLADLANSTGKSFDQLSEAIIDAQTGEFERLKEFGIRASKEGDNVKFTFKGVETQAKFTGEAIREYIVGLGDLNGVSGSTAAISQTLEGRISNLGDSYDQFLNVIGERTAPIIGAAIGFLSDLIGAATEAAKSLDQAISERNISGLKDSINQDKEQLDDYILVYETAGVMAVDAMTRATKEIIVELSLQRSELIQNGKDVNGVEVTNFNTRIANLEKFLSDYLAKKEKSAVEDAKKAKKANDEAYKAELARLKELEENDLKEARILDKDKKDLLDIEIKYNNLRQDAFRSFNQTNLEELRSYGLDERAERKEQLEYLRKQEALYNKQISDDEKAKNEIINEFGESKKAADEAARLDRLAQEQDAFEREMDLQLRLEEDDKKKKSDQIKRDKEVAEAKKMIYQQLYNGLGDLVNTYAQNLQIQTQNEISDSEVQRKAELRQFEGNKQAQNDINAKYDKEQRKLKQEQAQRDKDLSLFNIGLSTAEGVVKALGSTAPPYNFVLAAIVGAMGAAQLALVSSRPLPKYATGVEMLNGEGTETSDSILARLSKGERVVTAQENKDYFPALTAIHNRHIPPEMLNGFVMNYGAKEGGSVVMVNNNSEVVSEIKSMSRKLDKIKQLNINIDKNGIHAHLEEEYQRTEFVNSYITK